MVDATKRKADLLEDQNLIMLMIADEAGIVSEDAREWVILKRRAELRKLRKKLAEDEEFKAEGRLGGRSTAGTTIPSTTTAGPLQDDLDSPDNHRSDSPDNLDFSDNLRSTATPSAAFTPVGAEVARLPRQHFRQATKILANQWGGWGGLQLGSVANSQSWEEDRHNMEHHWSQNQGTEDWCQREKNTDDESQGELNLNMNMF